MTAAISTPSSSLLAPVLFRLAFWTPDSAVVSPGFWHANEETPRLERDPTRFRNDVEAMKASGADWQLVTSWNEWGKGTSVEPAEQFGTTYLGILTDVLVPPP